MRFASASPALVAFLDLPRLRQLERALSRIQCASALDMLGLYQALGDFQRLAEQEPEGAGPYRLLVIDSIASIVGPMLDANGPGGIKVTCWKDACHSLMDV